MEENEVFFEENIENNSEIINDSELVDSEEILEDKEISEVSNQDIISSLEELIDKKFSELDKSEEVEEYEELDNEENIDEPVSLFSTESGVDNETNYTQYIYDLLNDGSVNIVDQTEETLFLNKPIIDYTVNEGLLLCIFVLLLGYMIFYFINHNVFKWRN